MAEMTATDAKNKFGELLDMVHKEPVRIQKNGRDVAVVVSAEDYRRLTEGASGDNPLIVKLHAKSVKRRGKDYEALAK